MEFVVLDKFSGLNFPSWKVKIQLQLMNKNLWGIVNGSEGAPTDAKELVEWKNRDDKAKSIIGLALSNSQLHHVDLTKTSQEIWEHLAKLFGVKSTNAKFSLKVQLFSLKMNEETSMSSHINNLMSLLRQLGEAGTKVEDEDAKAVLLNSLPSSYSNVVFTLSQISTQTLQETIAALLGEEKRLKPEDAEENSHVENALWTKSRMRKKNANKGGIECHYCKKIGHTAWNCKSRASDVLKGKESANITTVEYQLNSDDEFNEESEPIKLF